MTTPPPPLCSTSPTGTTVPHPQQHLLLIHPSARQVTVMSTPPPPPTSTSGGSSTSIRVQSTLPWQFSSTTTTGPSATGGPSSPIRVRSFRGHQFSVDPATYREMIERRKSFRCRGSLGPTVASAPSVELEDYRTPRPSVCDIKNGKSFDFGGENAASGHLAYETNGLVKVSADFLRLNGSRQQFRNLLSARKKLGQMPPAYTCIDYSHDSIESNSAKPHAGPVITVEDTGPLFDSVTKHGSLPSIHRESRHSSFGSAHINVNGGATTGMLTLAPPGKPPGGELTRNNSRYGVPVDETAVKMIYKQRSERLNTRVQITDRCLALAMTGIFFMVLDSEMCGQNALGIDKEHAVSLMFRVLVAFSTLALLIEIVHYHINEILLDLVDCGADDWRVVLTGSRIVQFTVEFVVCSICPLPWTGTMNWIFIEPSRFHHVYSVKPVPVDVILSLFMLGRVYLFGRFTVLHSKQFQDASTRTLAALNRIQVNFSFVMKTVLDQRPILFLTLFTLIFWVTTAWTFAQCERIGRDEEPRILYSNALWFIAISFMLNGYGDVVPKTNAGRMIAIAVGVFGAIISSILIAVISRKILLSHGQRNVNNFMNDSKLTQRHKHAAARVLQKTWHIYKTLQSSEAPDHILRQHQRHFLEAIHDFRRIKNKMRVFGESTQTSMQQMNRLMTEMHTSMQKLAQAQDEMRAQVDVLTRTMRNHFFYSSPPQQGGSPTPAIMSSPLHAPSPATNGAGQRFLPV